MKQENRYDSLKKELLEKCKTIEPEVFFKILNHLEAKFAEGRQDKHLKSVLVGKKSFELQLMWQESTQAVNAFNLLLRKWDSALMKRMLYYFIIENLKNTDEQELHLIKAINRCIDGIANKHFESNITRLYIFFQS